MQTNFIFTFGVGLFICFYLGGLAALAQDKNDTQTEIIIPMANVACGPWLQAVKENEFTVVWTTNVKAAVWVEIAPDDGSHFHAKTRPRFFQTKYGRRVTGTLHRVTVSGLQPGTTYRYRIYQQAVLLNEGNKRMVLADSYGTNIRKGGLYSVTTFDTGKGMVQLSVVNDIHGNEDLFRKLMAEIEPEQTDFVVFNGDMLSQIESELQLTEGYLRSASELFASDVPFFALRGNHDLRGKFSYHYFDYFPSPNGKPYFAFRNGPACFVFLDSGEDKPDTDVRFYGLSAFDQFREEEAIWLKKTIESEVFRSAPIKVVFMHMPPVQRDWHGELEIQRLFMPLLNNAGIDLMVCGHIHQHSFVTEGEVNKTFPVLINSNDWRTDLKIDSSGIDIRLVDSSGVIVKKYDIKK